MSAPLTLAEHGQIAADLTLATAAILRVLRRIGQRRRISALHIDRLLRLDREIDQLKSDLEDVLTREHPGADVDRFYFPRHHAGQTLAQLPTTYIERMNQE